MAVEVGRGDKNNISADNRIREEVSVATWWLGLCAVVFSILVNLVTFIM